MVNNDRHARLSIIKDQNLLGPLTGVAHDGDKLGAWDERAHRVLVQNSVVSDNVVLAAVHIPTRPRSSHC